MNKIEFKLEPKRSYTTECPLCSKYREKKGTKSLQVFRDPDGFIRWQCMHVGQCDNNERQYAKDPDPQYTDHDKVIERDIATPIQSEVTDYIDGHRVWWYKDMDKNNLFGIIRLEIDGKKSYRPVREVDGLLTYKGTTWPDNKVLFNQETLKDYKTVIVVEGEKAAEVGAKVCRSSAVVTWRGGAANISSGDWDLLLDKEVIFWPDNDEPGKAVMQRIFEESKLTKAKLAYVDHLPPKADLADNLSISDMNRAFNEATTLQKFDEGLMSWADIIQQHEDTKNPLITGIEAIDTNIRLPTYGVVVIEGRTNHGKSTFGIHIVNALLKRGKRVAVFNYEENTDKIISRFVRDTNPELSMDDSFYSEGSQYYKELKEQGQLNLYDQKYQLPIETVCKKLDSPRWKEAVIVIDNLQIIPVRGGDRRLAIKDAMDRLRVLANKWGFVIVAMSQVTPDKNPRFDVARESKDIHNAASMILRIWNTHVDGDHPKYSKGTPGNFHVELTKNRYGAMGKVMGFDLKEGATFEFKGLGERVLTKNVEENEVGKGDVKKLVKAIQELADAMTASQISRKGVL